MTGPREGEGGTKTQNSATNLALEMAWEYRDFIQTYNIVTIEYVDNRVYFIRP